MGSKNQAYGTAPWSADGLWVIDGVYAVLKAIGFLGIVQLSDGPCGVLGIGSSGVYGSAGVPSAVSFGPILSGSSILGSQYTANSCVWECPVSAGSYGGFYGSTLGPINQASPYIVGGYASSAFPYSSFSNTATG